MLSELQTRTSNIKATGSSRVTSTTLKLLNYCRVNNWAGYDPYDALNSGLFKVLPFSNFRLARLVLTQAMKRSPINFRPFLRVPATQNPKGLAVFLMAFLKLSRLGFLRDQNLIDELASQLSVLRSKGTPYWCWGYNFDWQSRTTFIPLGSPNVICTTFAANALLDLYDESAEQRFLEMAVSAGEFLFNDLYSRDGDSAWFNYTPLSQSQVHNANLLGAAFICRLCKETKNNSWRDAALQAARFSAGRQSADGSWPYGESTAQRWIDNFHTGYNLCALQSIGQDLQTTEFEAQVQRGFDFYRAHFFTADGAARYFHNRTYPINSHSVAQSIITLVAFSDSTGENVALARSVLAWALDNLYDAKGFFYYEKSRYVTTKISYMRWSQAWMLLALATLLEKLDEPVTEADKTTFSSTFLNDSESSNVAPAVSMPVPPCSRYVLITAARDEADFIELTLKSVVAQGVKPSRWIIVSDGSTDGTDEIVATYVARYPWIELLRMPERAKRHFGGKANAFNAGYKRVADLEFEYIGNLDADISFDEDYFAFLLQRFSENEQLGVAGTPFREGEIAYDYRFVSIEHVSGACQLFRRACFEDVGGYLPLKAGGVDHVAVLTARMKGWQTRTFMEKTSEHHRPQGSALRNLFRSKLHDGKLDHALGGHPFWEIFRSFYQMTQKPYVIGGVLVWMGYLSAMIRRQEKSVSREVMAFRRREQMGRLRKFLGNVFNLSGESHS